MGPPRPRKVAFFSGMNRKYRRALFHEDICGASVRLGGEPSFAESPPVLKSSLKRKLSCLIYGTGN
jgi:hypothetical protein